MVLISITGLLLLAAFMYEAHLVLGYYFKYKVNKHYINAALDDVARMHAYLQRRGLSEGWKYYREHGQTREDKLMDEAVQELKDNLPNESDIQT